MVQGGIPCPPSLTDYTTVDTNSSNPDPCGFYPEAPGERAEAVARFRLTTRHDFLGVHLHCLGLWPR
ncbi:hypothetical protein TNCV_2739881 [Trichonephila clavipes]|nr:hypothetical protein TNCV_2739881 [Trichonephila clavipes]